MASIGPKINSHHFKKKITDLKISEVSLLQSATIFAFNSSIVFGYGLYAVVLRCPHRK